LDDKEREELEELRAIVHGVDRIIKKLTKKYLKDAPRGRLPLESFFDLLLLKVKKISREKAFETLVSEEVQTRIFNMVKGYTGEHIRSMVYLPVIVRRVRKKERHIKRMYRAICLRGNVPKGTAAETPEEAYTFLRPEIERHFSTTIVDVGQCKMDLMEEYDAAKYMKEDVVSGFRAIIKLFDNSESDDEEEETDAG
jgi:hypothetical protein